MEQNNVSLYEKLTGEGIRNHFSKFIADTLKTSWAIILIIVFNLVETIADGVDEMGGLEPWMVAIVAVPVLLILLLLFGFNYLRWRKTTISIKDDSLVINNNYFFRKKIVTVRLDSISSVNYQRGIFEYLFNTYKLQIDANSSVTADETDFNLVFDKDTAERVKTILTYKSEKPVFSEVESGESVASSDEPAETQKKLIYEFSFGQVVRHCLLSISVVALAISVALAIGSIWLAGEEGAGVGVVGFVISIVFVVFPILWSQISPFVHFYGFKIEREGKKAVVSYGLVTRRQFNLPLDKTNAIKIEQPLFARIFGYCYGELINVGMGDDDNNNTPIFCLCVKKDEMQEIIKELKPELQVGGTGEKSPSSAYIPTVIPYFCFAAGVAAGANIFLDFADFWWEELLVLAFCLIIPILSYKTKSLAVLSDKAVISSGVFHKETMIVPNAKIQNISVTSGPLTRKLGLSKGTVTILASVLYRNQPIGYFKTERYDQLLDNMVYSEKINSSEK